jgi:hypothetical protein
MVQHMPAMQKELVLESVSVLPNVIMQTVVLLTVMFEWRYVHMETFLTHSCNKISHFWPSEIIVGTEINLMASFLMSCI